jgi:glucose-1-phosphate thymidylyltransferase
MKAIVLAAGFATRMYPLTRTKAKPLLDVAGAPILTHILLRVEALDEISSAVVVANRRFYGDFVRWADTTKFRFPVEVVSDGASEDENRLGAVRDMALGMEHAAVGEDCLVVAGDTLVDVDLAGPAAVFHANRRPLLLVRDVDARGASPYNDVEVDPGGRVTSFREKPADANSGLAAICLYFFPAEVRALVRRYLDTGANPDSPGRFVEWLVRETPVDATRFTGRWFDIGSIEGLEHARREWARAGSRVV